MASLLKQLIQNTPLIEHWIAKSNCCEICNWLQRKYTNNICKSCFKVQIYPLFLFESKAWISIFHQTFYKSHSFFNQIRFCQTYSILVLYACTWRIYKERLTINNINITFMFSDFYITHRPISHAMYGKCKNEIYLKLMILLFHW